MNLSFFNQKKQPTNRNKTWLCDKELSELQALSEQLHSTSISKITLDSQQSGHLSSRALGSGIDYAESRVYQYGDDPRSINWRLSARSQETFVKTFHTESRPTVNIILDQRRSMIFGTKKRLKITQALRIASLLAYTCNLHHLNFQAWILNANTLLTFNNTGEFLSVANQQPKQIENTFYNNLDLALQEVQPQLSNHSLLYLISDFTDLQKSTHLSAVSELCTTHAIHIQDQAEIDLSNLGEIDLQGNQQEHFRINTENKNERLNFSKLCKTLLEKRKKLIANLGISYSAILTDEDNIPPYIRLPLRNL